MKTRLIPAALILISLSLVFHSCKKEAGEGGNSSINGKVWVRDYNSSFTTVNGEYPGADEDVYIIYGGDYSYGDRIKTDYEGNFEFKYLREGNYKVYVYSKDSTLQDPSGKVAVIKEVEITKKKQKVTAPLITILN